MTTLTGSSSLPKVSIALASNKLPSSTVDELEEFLASESIRQTSGAGVCASITDYTMWIRDVLREPKGIANNNIQRLLWHHADGKVLRGQRDDLQFIVGLMQTDTHWGERTTLNREQETALMLVEQALAGGTGRGISYGNAYGNGLEGVRLLYPRLGEYAIAHPDRAEEMTVLIAERGIRNIDRMKPLFT